MSENVAFKLKATRFVEGPWLVGTCPSYVLTYILIFYLHVSFPVAQICSKYINVY